MRLPITISAVAVVSFGAGYAVFRTHTGGDAVGATIEVVGWRAQSALSVDEDRREPEQKLNDLLALTAKPASLARDRALNAAIEAMNAQDFHALGADPATLAARFEKLPRDLRSMLVEAMMDRWLVIDADSALAWVKAARLVAETRLKSGPSIQRGNAAFDGLLAALARHQPDRLFDLAQETAPMFGRTDAIESAMLGLAERDPADARRRLATVDQDDRRVATRGLVRGWAKVDPPAAAAFILSIADVQERDYNLFLVMAAGGQSDSATVMKVFHVLPKEQRRSAWSGLSILASEQPAAARQLLDDFVSQYGFAAANPDDPTGLPIHLGRNDPAGTVEWINGWSEEMVAAVGPKFFQGVVQGWAESDPAAALEWGIAQQSHADSASKSNDDLMQTALGRWLIDDHIAADAWIKALPAGDLHDRANQALAEYLIRNGDSADAALSYSSSTGTDARGELAQRIASALANKDPSAAAAWSLALPGGAGRSSAIKTIATAWLAKDMSAAVAWFEQLPTSSDRDAGASALAAATVHAEPGTATEWVCQIADPKVRADAAASVFGIWNWTDPKGARAWLRSLNGVDERWKETFLRRAR